MKHQIKIMLIGPRNSGKTTIIQTIMGKPKHYRKTQTLEFVKCFVDTPGEYMENPKLYHALITTAMEVDIVGAVIDAVSKDYSFPPDFFRVFNAKVVGIINKIDLPQGDPEYGVKMLKQAGVDGPIVKISAVTGEGVNKLKQELGLCF